MYTFISGDMVEHAGFCYASDWISKGLDDGEVAVGCDGGNGMPLIRCCGAIVGLHDCLVNGRHGGLIFLNGTFSFVMWAIESRDKRTVLLMTRDEVGAQNKQSHSQIIIGWLRSHCDLCQQRT